jgi:hypothetical protein
MAFLYVIALVVLPARRVVHRVMSR